MLVWEASERRPVEKEREEEVLELKCVLLQPSLPLHSSPVCLPYRLSWVATRI